ncbi:hypothetical protein Trydic_g7755 [Trypoxylus dichotomus]
MCRSLHPIASLQRLYLPRREGGRGLINIEWLHNRRVIGAVYQIRRSSDPLICMVREAEQDGTQGSFLLKAAELKTLLKRSVCQHLKEEHLQKPMHGQYFKLVSEQGLSPELSFSYLTSPTLYSETERYITAVQDGVVHTLAYAKRVLGMPLEDTRCRACRTHEETVMHLLSACPRHEYKVDKQSIAPHQVRDPGAVITNDRCTMYWNFSFSTTTQLPHNKPDLVIPDSLEKKIVIASCTAPYGPIHPQTGITYWPNNSASEDGDVTDKRRNDTKPYPRKTVSEFELRSLRLIAKRARYCATTLVEYGNLKGVVLTDE